MRRAAARAESRLHRVSKSSTTREAVSSRAWRSNRILLRPAAALSCKWCATAATTGTNTRVAAADQQRGCERVGSAGLVAAGVRQKEDSFSGATMRGQVLVALPARTALRRCSSCAASRTASNFESKAQPPRATEAAASGASSRTAMLRHERQSEAAQAGVVGGSRWRRSVRAQQRRHKVLVLI